MQFYCSQCGAVYETGSLPLSLLLLYCEDCPHTSLYKCNGTYIQAEKYVVGMTQGMSYWLLVPWWDTSKLLTANQIHWEQSTAHFKPKVKGGTNVASRYSNYKRGGSSTQSSPFSSQYSKPSAPAFTKCTITWDSAAGVYMISAPYEPNFVEFIKLKIQPPRARAWDPNTKMWAVEESWLDLVQTLATELWTAACVSVITRSDVEKHEAEQREAQRCSIVASLPEKERAIYEFVTALPFEAVQAAYRKAAMLLHPDRNPTDGDAMSKLNAAWSRIEKEFGK